MENQEFKKYYTICGEKKELPHSKYLKVRIPIDTSYKWGPGWTNMHDAINFESEIPYLLEEEGFEVKPGDNYGGCATIDEKWGAYLYLHPMELTGYLSEEQIQKVLNALNKASSVKSVGPVQKEDVYCITDTQYELVLLENLDLINTWIDKHPHSDGFKFASQYRIPRFRDKCILGSDDVDIRYIDRLKEIKEHYNLVKIEN